MAQRRQPPNPPSPHHDLGAVTHLPQGTMHSATVGALPILNHFLQRMNLEDILYNHLPADDRRHKVPVARALLVLVKNLLLSREPLYGLAEWVARHDTHHLGLTPAQAHALNDDCLGRALTIFFHSNRPVFILALVRVVMATFHLTITQLHNDSTTISFCGAYTDAATEKSRRDQTTLAITWGHNKDHRPDLKQLLYILTITDDGAVPIYFRAASGNVTDDSTHRANWDLLCQIAGRRDFLYVADCKLATIDNMNYIADNHGRFVSVLPRTRKEDNAFRNRVLDGTVSWQPLWQKCNDDGDIVDSFSVQEEAVVLPEGYRLWWYRSTHKADLDLASRSNRLQRAEHKLRHLQDQLRKPRGRHRNRDKVVEMTKKIIAYYDVTEYINIDIDIHQQETYRQRRRGRPGPNTEYVKHVTSRLELTYRLDAEELTRVRRSDGIFPLVTNDKNLSALTVLQAYKGQPQIEKRFEQLKTDFAVAPVFLKDVGRIEALLAVYFLALLLQSLIERDLRQAMARAGIESLPLYPEGRPCRCPTVRRLIDVFEPIQRHTLQQAGAEPTMHVTELTPLQRKLLHLLGVPTAAFR